MGLYKQKEFAKFAGVSSVSICKAIKAGILRLDENKRIDDSDPLSLSYLLKQNRKSIKEKKIYVAKKARQAQEQTKQAQEPQQVNEPAQVESTQLNQEIIEIKSEKIIKKHINLEKTDNNSFFTFNCSFFKWVVSCVVRY
jgi:hypothetical protein